MRRIALAVVLFIGMTVQAQTNRSSSPSAAAPPVEKGDAGARGFLTKGLKLLEDGDNEAAAVAFADGLLQYGAATSSAMGDSMVHAALNHGAAVANLRLSKLPPAKQAIDRAQSSRWTNDSLIYNAATIATAIRLSAPTAVNLLDKYLAAHPDTDETWVNLFGLALDKAAIDAASRTRLEPKFKILAEHQTRLEAKSEGKHRWGSELLEDSEWKEIKSKKDEADKKLAELQAEVDTAQKNLQQAQQSAASANARPSRGGGRGQRGGGGSRGGGAGQVTAARDQLTAAQKALADADRGPQPKWDVPLTGIQPVAEMTLK